LFCERKLEVADLKEVIGLKQDVARLGYNRRMAANAVVRSRVSVEVKDEATEVLSDMGLTVSDLMRIVLTRVAKERTLPFDLRPNALTRETMEKSERGEDVYHAKDAADLFEKLGI
jgi:DNA-damage-inducible protein J